MKAFRSILFIGIIIMAASCSRKPAPLAVNVQRAPVAVASEGYFYFLPRTVIAVDVAVTRTIHQPGPFAQYAESLLGLQQVIRTPSVDYTISEINIQSYAEPDPDQLFFVEFDRQNPHLFLSLSEAGLIQSANMSFDSDELFKSLGEIKEYGHFGTEATFNYFIDINLQERIDTIMERVRLDTITVERQTLRRSMVEKSTDVRAKEVADYILRIRDEKFNLITGFAEITYSKEAIEFMYNQMSKKENDYLALFTGISSSSTIKYRYTFTPDITQSSIQHTLFHFSVKDGVLGQGSSGSIPVSILVKPISYISKVNEMLKRPEQSRPGNKGFFYRIPAYSNVFIQEGNRIRAEARTLINQYGVVTSLPPYMMEVEFNPGTGSIKSAGKTKME